MARDPNNPTKLRAQDRAYEIGKTLNQVYKEAGVNLAYLTELPKTGWRQDKLQAIATALNWTVDELTRRGNGQKAGNGAGAENRERRFARDVNRDRGRNPAVAAIRTDGAEGRAPEPADR